MRDDTPAAAALRYAAPAMRALSSFVGLAILVGAGCAFRPSGGDGTAGDDGDGGQTDGPAGIDTQATTDAPLPIDAPTPFDPARCPSSYDKSVDSLPQRYRIAGSLTGWDSARGDCANDSEGLTHLVVLDDPAEREAVLGILDRSLARVAYWLGVDREGGQTRSVSGQTVWEPNVNLGNGQALYWATLLEDTVRAQSKSNNFHWVLCECDGRPSR